MALSNVTNNAPVEAPVAPTTPAPAAPVAGTAPQAPAGKPATGKGNSKAEAFRNHGASLGTNMTEEAKALEGSKSDKVEFLSCLGDPSRKQKRAVKGDSVDCITVVGYALKVLEDCEVPYAPLKEGFKDITDCEPIQMKPAKAGETIYLNNFECGYFISQPQYAGTFSGGGKSVQFTVKWANDRPDPLPILKKVGAGSIKTEMIEIAESSTTPDGKTAWKVKEGFEKFSALYKRKTASRTGKSAKAPSAVQKDLARAFLAYVNDKKSN